jgi:hypothetical protein
VTVNTSGSAAGTAVPPSPATSLPPAARAAALTTTPGRLRALTVAALVMAAALFAVAALTIRDAHKGLEIIGHDAGPQVVATTDLYYALSDMDARLAGALLIGKDDLGVGREQALRLYDQRRAEADRALLQAAELAAGDPIEQQTASTLLDGLGRYERLAGQALTLDQQSGHAAGRPPGDVTALYRRATDLMKLDLLPKAYNITLDSGTIVRHTYDEKRGRVLSGRIWVLLTGLALLAILVGLQLYLHARYRRIINPGLALATVLTLILVAATVTLLNGQARHLKTAKHDGFDSVLSLSRARAISNNAHADESRYLLDPGRAETYEQLYFDKSQSILYVRAQGLDDVYYGGVDRAVATAGPSKVDFLGFYGTEARTLTGSDPKWTAFRSVLSAYQTMQHDDRQLRRLVASNDRQRAIETFLDSEARDFAAYDRALVSLTAQHSQAFDGAIRAGDHGLRGWNALLPAGAALIVVLLLAGVWPRLSEYR